jgi:Nucleotidyl transferase AbiEii toxin, Type IV TA system
VVVLDPLDDATRELWRRAIDVLDHLDGQWTLVGGLMVQLHVARAGEPASRPTEDIDIIGDSRKRPSATERIAARLIVLGFRVADVLVEPATAFRFVRDGAIVDVLAPEGTGRRHPPKTVEGFQTIQVPGGTQALARTETVCVRLDDVEADIRCPSLLGALLLKARAVRNLHRYQDREDLIRLLGCVDDPVTLSAELKKSERSWLRRAGDRLRLDDPGLSQLFSADQLARARAAYTLLTRAGS